MTNIISVTFTPKVKPSISKKSLIHIANMALNYMHVQKSIEMGIVITDDHEIRNLNRDYRNIDNATDVLSFQMQTTNIDDLMPDFINPPDDIKHLGEVIISYETALRQARESRVTVKDELTFLLIHGILHLLNYDHVDEDDRKLMETREQEVFEYINKNRGKFT
jgi:probable rRNA maturation factor